MKTSKGISVSMISFNEESNIARTLGSIRDIADEIIIVDAGSTDRTCEIASGFGANIFSEPWKGHIAQKNSALEKCTCDWILCLDCDEVISPELKESILRAVTNESTNGFYINRKTFYLGKLLKYAWQPDRKLRLVRRDAKPTWTGIDPHDELFVSGERGTLQGDLIHYSYKNISHHFEKTIFYAKNMAESYFKAGRKSGILNIIINPGIAFIRLYIINRGFLDGIRGLIAGFSTYAYTFLKYVFLWELRHNNES